MSEFGSRRSAAAGRRSGSVAALGLTFLAGMLVALFALRFLGARSAPEATDGRAVRAGSTRDAPSARAAGADAGVRAEAPDSELLELRSALEIEHAMRERLTQEVKRLESLLAERGEGAPETDAEGKPVPDPGAGSAQDASASDDPTAGWFGARELLALGMDASEVERIRQRWEQREMDKLYLADEYARAAARGERRTGHLVGLMEIEKAVLEDLGEASYDAMLYASGARNRLLLTDVIDDSPAYGAGLRPGDQLLRYDGNRIYRLGLLKRLTTQGEAGESVEVSVLRGDRTLHFFVPRGPLGVRTEAVRRPPLLR